MVVAVFKGLLLIAIVFWYSSGVMRFINDYFFKQYREYIENELKKIDTHGLPPDKEQYADSSATQQHKDYQNEIDKSAKLNDMVGNFEEKYIKTDPTKISCFEQLLQGNKFNELEGDEGHDNKRDSVGKGAIVPGRLVSVYDRSASQQFKKAGHAKETNVEKTMELDSSAADISVMDKHLDCATSRLGIDKTVQEDDSSQDEGELIKFWRNYKQDESDVNANQGDDGFCADAAGALNECIANN